MLFCAGDLYKNNIVDVLIFMILGSRMTKSWSFLLKMTITGICLALSIVQIITAIQKVKRKPTMTSMDTKSLKSLDQAIIISVCKTNQIDGKRSKSIGYTYPRDVFIGNISTGESAGKILSWTCLSFVMEI